MAFNVVVDEEKCAGCEECVDVCPVEVFEMKDDILTLWPLILFYKTGQRVHCY
jgi:Fe-S-cluster-containing hydrogenase component 2